MTKNSAKAPISPLPLAYWRALLVPATRGSVSRTGSLGAVRPRRTPSVGSSGSLFQGRRNDRLNGQVGSIRGSQLKMTDSAPLPTGQWSHFAAAETLTVTEETR
jgi:hypothetical protein